MWASAGAWFDVIKFRSMYRDAESRSGPVWASENDPRITRVGRILRKYRIDELPQLFNVLRGNMALVGPRPERPHFFEELPPRRADLRAAHLRAPRRHRLGPGPRAPYASNISDSRTKLEYDLFYVLRRSPLFDLAIMLETVGVCRSRPRLALGERVHHRKHAALEEGRMEEQRRREPRDQGCEQCVPRGPSPRP